MVQKRGHISICDDFISSLAAVHHQFISSSSSVCHQFIISSSSLYYRFIISSWSVHHQFLISSWSVHHEFITSSFITTSSSVHHLISQDLSAKGSCIITHIGLRAEGAKAAPQKHKHDDQHIQLISPIMFPIMFPLFKLFHVVNYNQLCS